MKGLIAVAGITFLLAADVTGAAAAAGENAAVNSNPLLAPWTGPYGGVPPFDKARVEQLQPALTAGMQLQLEEIARIASNPAPPTFENTIAAMERTGRALDRALTIYGIFTSNLKDDAVQAVEQEMEPKLAAFSDQIGKNGDLVAEGREDPAG